MKYSEETNAPLSSRNALHLLREGHTNTVFNTPLLMPTISDKRIDERRYGVALKRGNFRKTQEDRVSQK
jgi:hypothetical protein